MISFLCPDFNLLQQVMGPRFPATDPLYALESRFIGFRSSKLLVLRSVEQSLWSTGHQTALLSSLCGVKSCEKALLSEPVLSWMVMAHLMYGDGSSTIVWWLLAKIFSRSCAVFSCTCLFSIHLESFFVIFAVFSLQITQPTHVFVRGLCSFALHFNTVDLKYLFKSFQYGGAFNL